MPERLDRNYHSISDMDQDGANVSWKKFFVHLAGNTTGAHHAVVDKLKAVGQTEVSTPDECDYILLFCPIVSRVGTDVSEALENMPVSWKKFFVHLAGNTTGAHHAVVDKLKAVGQIDSSTLDECDYILLFCPIVSRVGTDVSEALENMPAGKRVIMVVMHHTFNPEQVLAESRRLVNNPNVRLVVDSLFHEGKFLDCKCNDIARHEIQKFVGVSSSQVPFWVHSWNWIKNRKMLFFTIGAIMIVYRCRGFWPLNYVFLS
uniref:uncharacterized protein n=1 Tax=Semicossyphus pulcher TaxID=241346 RepID=UPI0037E71D9E